jgi:predicted acylesterase/phospholipase RssA
MRPSLSLVLLVIAPGLSRGAPLPVSVTVAGGVSLGAYEAGLAYYAVETLRTNPGVAQVKIATGASAGSVNGLLILLQSCGPPGPDPRQSLFWKAWIPLGLAQLTQSRETDPTATFSRASFEAPVDMIRAAWAEGLASECDVVYGLSVTRLTPRQVSLKGERLQLPQVEEHFLVRIQGRGAGKPPRLTNYADPTWGGEQALLPEGTSGEVSLEALVDAIFASTAFPGAFPPQAVRHCIVRRGPEPWPGCPEASAGSDLFVDGGVFDNTPLRLSTGAVAAGLRLSSGGGRWLDQPDLSERKVPDQVVFTYISTEIRSFPATDQDVSRKASVSILGMASQVGTSFFDSARAKNLLTLHADLPDFFDRLNLPERHLPAASSPLGAFSGSSSRSCASSISRWACTTPGGWPRCASRRGSRGWADPGC